jgi:cysteine desulfurase
MFKSKKYKIYLDYSAATPLDPRVKKAMEPYWSEVFGNPSSQHWAGRQAVQVLDSARQTLADFLACSPREVIFTSGATEANNLAIRGAVKAARRAAKKIHIITSSIEHPSVLEVFEDLAKEGVAVSIIKPQRDGVVSAHDILRAVKKETLLVSLMHVNNEVGTIQPVGKVGKEIMKLNESRQFPVYFHSDAAQALNYCPVQIGRTHVNLMSMSAQKIYGPKGAGALFVKAGTLIAPVMAGGLQEYGLRPGTVPLPLIVGMTAAINLLVKDSAESVGFQRIKKLHDRLLTGIKEIYPAAQVNGSLKNRVPANLNVTLPGIDAQAFEVMIDQAGAAISKGAACATGAKEPSHVLASMGLSPSEIENSYRLVLGRVTRKSEIEGFLTIFKKVINKLQT